MSQGPGLRLVAVAATGPGTVKVDGERVASITDALQRAVPGSVIDVGRGRYDAATETFPLRVPDGVTLRGPVPPDVPREARKHLPTPAPAEVVAEGPAVLVEGSKVRIEHLTIRTTTPDTSPALWAGGPVGSETAAPQRDGRATPRDGIVVDSCVVDGGVDLGSVRDVALRWTTIRRGPLRADRVVDFQVTGGAVEAPGGDDPAVAARACTGVRLEAMVIQDAAVGVDLEDADGALVAGCAVLADAVAVRALDCTGIQVSGNRLRAERAVVLERCGDGSIAANGVERATTAFVVQGCTGIEIGFNHLGEVGIAEVNDDV